MGVVTIYKCIGETPLAALDRLRDEQPELANETLSYIGRLDPMAEGEILVLVGEENKNREKYLALDKEYECEILFGFATDTHDILGLVTENAIADFVTKEMIEEKLKLFLGKRVQSYPPYSSKPVDGKPLFAWAKEGRLDQIEIPTKEIEIYSIELLDWRTVRAGTLLVLIQERVALVSGDFRQKEILTRWQEVFGGEVEKDLSAEEIEFLIAKIRVSCSSGTYMRSLADALGKAVGVPALALGIKRIKMMTKEFK